MPEDMQGRAKVQQGFTIPELFRRPFAWNHSYPLALRHKSKSHSVVLIPPLLRPHVSIPLIHHVPSIPWAQTS